MRTKVLKIINVVFPVIAIVFVFIYETCYTSCSLLKGTFLGLDLKMMGMLYTAALLALTLPPADRHVTYVNNLRTMVLSGAMGGEIILVRFQVIHDTYCPYCLVFAFCVVVLFIANFMKMNKYLALGAFLAGIATFALFFKGSVLPPLYF
jgi:uncharacterized membrane protein